MYGGVAGASGRPLPLCRLTNYIADLSARQIDVALKSQVEHLPFD